MSEQERFDAALKKVLKVSPEELKRRIAASKSSKKLLKGDAKAVSQSFEAA